TATPTSCPPGGPGAWLLQSPLPGNRMAPAVASLGGYLYAAGGHTSTGLQGAAVSSDGPLGGGFQTNRAARFDGTSWRAIPWLPEHLMNAMGVSDGSKFYVIGGFQSSLVPVLVTLQIFDPATLTWTYGAAMPEGLAGSAAVYHAGKIYVMGGCVDGTCTTTNSMLIYDVATNSWSFGANLPVSVAYGSAEVIGNYIYFAGGANSGAASAGAYRYDPATNTWDDASVADMPEPWWGAASGVLDGKLYMFGGIANNAPAPTDRTILYDPASNTWSSAANLNVATYRQEGDNLNGRLYIVGGSTGGFEATDRVERFAPNCNAPPPTATATATSQASATLTHTATRTRTPTGTSVPTHTAGPSATPSSTVETTGTPTVLPPSTATYTPTTEVTGTPTTCALAFGDVPPENTFYPFVRCLACRDIVSGYPCGGPGEPCNANNDPYFRPNNHVTRAQLSKIVSNAAGFSEPPGEQAFEDVPPGYAFFDFIQRLAARGHISGYPCGGPGEPCGADNLPYFRPGNGATRGQLTKIASNAAGFSDTIPPGQYSFSDVPEGSAFHLFVERLLLNRPDAMAGYDCGGPGEPCDPGNRPYFRPGNALTRGQASKILANTFFPGCEAR
ncbi:MAG TPA: kelch repeat-containing protein, partial [Chloroflexia bacterium]|nr:kelch repeat-containing protein [Chloroflexia bacterium]